MAKDDLSKDTAKNLQIAAKALVDASEKLNKAFAKGSDFAQGMNKAIDESAKKQKTVADLTQQITGFNQDLESQIAKRVEQEKAQAMAMRTGQSIAIATLQIEKVRALIEARRQKASDEELNNLADQYNKAIQLTQEYENQVAEREAASDLADKLQQQQDQLMDSLKEITGYEGVFEEIFTDGRLAAGIFANQLLKGLKNTTELFNSAREEGLTFTQSMEESATALSDSFSLTGTSAKDSMEVMSAMREELGNIEEVSRNARLEAASLAKTYGISNQEAAKLTAQLSTMPGATMETANDTAEFAGNMAKAAGVAPGAVLKDMAKNSEAVAAYGKDGGKNMAVMAVAAKKVGIEMDSMVNAAESLLDFESSIEKQMEASVLLGREINLDKARQLALEGDLAGATKEMLANVGGEAEFNQMNVKQRQALAASMGVSVAELQKMVKNQDKLNDLSEDQLAALEAGEVTMDELLANAGGFLDKMKGLAVTVLSGVKGFSTMVTGLKDASELTSKIGKTKLGQYIKDTAHWAKEKAHMLWKKVTGQQITKQATEGAGGAGAKMVDAGDKAVDKSTAMSKKAGAVKKPGGFAAAMRGIRNGIQAFAVNPAKTLMGVGVLVVAGAMLGVGLAAIAMGISAMGGDPKDMINTGAALVLFAGSFYLMTLALGKVSPADAAKGALAMILLSAALIPAAFAFSLLKGVDTESIIAFSIALPLLGLAAAGLGLLSLFIALGAGALALLGVGVIVAAEALMMLAAAEGGVQALQGLLTMFAENPGVGLAMLGTAMAMFVFSGALFALAIAAFFGAPALIALGAGMLALGLGVKFASEGLVTISEALPAIAKGVGALGAVVPMLALASLFLMQLGFASLIATPGLLIGSFALGMLAATMGVFAAAVSLAIPGVGLLLQLGSMADSFAMIAESMFAMAAGITAFATAGLLTLPTIMGLIALSFVAPILTALGDSINYDLGGGSSVEQAPEEDKMNVLIEEIRALRAAFQTPGTINMDGQKVGDVLGLAVSNSGVS